MQLGMKHCGRFTDRRVGGPGLRGVEGASAAAPQGQPRPRSPLFPGVGIRRSFPWGTDRTGHRNPSAGRGSAAVPNTSRAMGSRDRDAGRPPPPLSSPPPKAAVGPDPRSCSEGTDYSRPPGRRGATRTRSGPMGPAGLSLGAGEFLGVRRRQCLSCGWRSAPQSGSSPPQRGDAHRRRHTPRCHGQRATGRELGDSDNRP